MKRSFFIKLKLATGYEEVIGDLGPDFKDILDGLDEETICELKKTIYGLIQAAFDVVQMVQENLGRSCEEVMFKENRGNHYLFVCG